MHACMHECMHAAGIALKYGLETMAWKQFPIMSNSIVEKVLAEELLSYLQFLYNFRDPRFMRMSCTCCMQEMTTWYQIRH